MASNPNDSPNASKKKGRLLGLPVWAWGIGAGAFVLAVFIFFRQSQSSSGQQTNQAGVSTGPLPAGATSPTVYPFYMGNTPQQQTQSQQFGNAVVQDPQGYKVPLSSVLGGAPTIWLNSGSQVQTLGPALQTTWAGQPIEAQPVSYLGTQYYANVNNLMPTFNSLSSLNQQAPQGIYG